MWKKQQLNEDAPQVLENGILSIEQLEDETIVKLSGVINSQICKELAEEDIFNNKKLTIDLALVTYLSSAGIKMLSQFALMAKTKDIKYKVINANSEITKILSMTGYSSSFELLSKE